MPIRRNLLGAGPSGQPGTTPARCVRASRHFPGRDPSVRRQRAANATESSHAKTPPAVIPSLAQAWSRSGRRPQTPGPLCADKRIVRPIRAPPKGKVAMSQYPVQSRTRVGAVMLAGALVLAAVCGQAAAEAAGPGPTSRAQTAGLLARSAPALVAAGSAYNNTVLADKPVGFWYDAHGRELVGGRDATRVGAPGMTRLPNGDSAATFDGARRYLEVADDDRWSPATTGVFTIEAWVRPSTLHFTSGNSDACYVHWLGKGVPEQQEWALRMYSDVTPCETPQRPNRTSVYAFNSSGGLGTGAYFQGGLNGVPAMRPGQWVHVVGVINARQRSSTYPNG